MCLWRGGVRLGVLILLWLCGVSTAATQVQQLATGEAFVRLARDGARHQLPVELPLHWDVRWPRQSGWALVRLHFKADPARSNESLALLIGRIGNAYRIRLNGTVVGAAGRLEQINDGWSNKRPLLLLLPAAQLKPDNVLEITIRADSSRRAGIGLVQVGPEHTMRLAWDRQEWRMVTLPRAVSLLSAMIAAFALLLWWQQRERVYLLAAACVLLWSFRMATLTWESDHFDWPTWFRITLLVFCLGCWVSYGLFRSVWGQRPRGETRLAWLLFAAGASVVAVGGWLPPRAAANAVTVWMVALVLAWGALTVQLAYTLFRAGKAPDGAKVWMLLLLAVGWVSLVRDVALARLVGSGYEALGWTIASALVVDAAVLCIASTRFQQARRALDAFQQSLQARLAQRERALSLQHERVQALEVMRSVAAERQRILRDMHDGAGAHLVTAMRQLEGGVASKAQVMQTLRESLDQLRLSIDAMNLPLGDVGALLGSLRFRLQPRIEDAGLRLDWSVPPLPPWPGATDAGTRHLQYILLEAVSNVLQHARALTLSVHAEQRGDAIVIQVRDDGRGPGLNQPHGQGMSSMKQRAAQAGVHLTVLAAEPGTCVELRLPLAPAVGAEEVQGAQCDERTI